MKKWTIASIVAAAVMGLGLVSVPASADDGRYNSYNNYSYSRDYDRGDHHRYAKKWRKNSHWRHNDRRDRYDRYDRRHRWHDRYDNDDHRWHGKKRRHHRDRDRDHDRRYWR